MTFLSGCSAGLKTSYSKLSKPEKSWVLFHPFKARAAYTISKESEHIKDSMKVIGSIGSDNNGGRLDAFKHTYWMARLTQRIGKGAALRLGKAHEKGNYQTYLRRRFEDRQAPDKPSTEMDLYNNNVGISIGRFRKKASKDTLIRTILDSLNRGTLRIVAKDSIGNFLDCSRKIIPPDSLRGKWNTKKCLVPSNFKSF